MDVLDVGIDASAAKRGADEFDRSARRISSAADGIDRKIKSLASEASNSFGIIGRAASSLGGIVTGALGFLGGSLITSGLSALTSGFTSVIQRGVSFNDTLVKGRIALTTLLGAKADVDGFIKSLAQFAEKTAFRFPQLLELTGQLRAFGFQGNQIIPILRDVGDAVAAVGGGADALNRIIIAFGQIKSAGRVTGEELRQLFNANLPVFDVLTEQTGLSAKRIKALAENNKLNADVFIELLQKGFRSRFGGLQEKFANETVEGLFSNFEDIADRRSAEAGKNLYDSLKKALQAGNQALGSDAAGGLAASINNASGVVLGPINGAIEALKTGNFTKFAKDAGAQIIDGITSAVKEGASSVLAGIQSLGTNILSGLTDAVKAGLSGIYDSGANIGSSIKKGAKEILGINSPSTVFLEIGLNVAEGFQRGIEIGTDPVTQSILKMMDTGIEAGKKKAGRFRLNLPDRSENALEDLMTREPSFIPKLKEIADKLQTRPEWLLQLIALETNGTFSPKVGNGLGYYGLIQFGPQARKGLGVSTEQLTSMSATQQLDYVLKYFEQNKGSRPLDSLAQLYSIVALPSARNLDESGVIASKEGTPTRFARNQAWNTTKDDTIFKSELGVAASSALRLDDALQALTGGIDRVVTALSMAERRILYGGAQPSSPALQLGNLGSVGTQDTPTARAQRAILDGGELLTDVVGKLNNELIPLATISDEVNRSLAITPHKLLEIPPAIDAISDAEKKLNRQRLLQVDEQDYFQKALRGSFHDFFTSVITGSKSLKEAFSGLLSSFAQTLAERLSTKLVDEVLDPLIGRLAKSLAGLFNLGGGSGGSSGGGGGFWSTLLNIGAKFVGSLFGKGLSSGSGGGDILAGVSPSAASLDASGFFGSFGKASGGYVDRAGVYNVGELGMERVFLPRGSYVQDNYEMRGAAGGQPTVIQPIINVYGVPNPQAFKQNESQIGASVMQAISAARRNQ